jgi:hypothetical protein
MRARTLVIIGCTLTTILVANSAAQEVPAVRSPVGVSWVTVTIQGTSKRGPFFASTKTVRVARVQLAEPRSADILEQVLRPGGFEAFDVTLPVMTLTSPDKGADEHIHDSLKADVHPEIRFQLRSTTDASTDAMGFVRLNAKGMLTVAGVDREVALNVQILRADRSLLVDGSTDVLMTDFGVEPPKGLLGMLKTDPWIHVRFYLVVTVEDE